LDRQSLRWKLPWSFGVTTALITAAFGVFAYAAVRTVSLQAAHTRLRSALSQVRTIVELGVINQLASLDAAANDSSIVDALRYPGQPIPERALLVLQRLRGVADSTLIVELIDRTGRIRHVIPESAELPGAEVATVMADVATIGPMYQRGDNVYSDATVSVSTSAGTLGGIRIIRPMRHGVNRRLVGNLVAEAELLTGNRDGSLWSDAGPVSYPLSAGDTSSRRYLRAGTQWISVASPVKGTPWLQAVELPERVALAPAHALVIPFAMAGVVVAVIGVLIGQRVSRRITTPLSDLTLATELLARGERGVPLVATDREDEIGRLARSFSIMAEQVAAARDRLEQEVTDRTGELSTVSGSVRALRQELEEAEKFAKLGRLSGSVGHELRNPLGVMSNVVFLIDALPDASAKLKDYASLLREQIRVSDRIISDLLDRAKSGAPVRSAVDVPALIDQILLRTGIPPSILIERHFHSPIPRVVLDRDHVGQILWNLVTNAVQALHGAPGMIRVESSYRDGRLRLEIRDSGGGIAATDVERIFEPMFTTKPHGIGLGLAVSRAFARANGGDLFAVAAVRGACLVLDLPCEIAPGDEALDPVVLPDELHRTRAGLVRPDSPPQLGMV
jgi:signal transduction histidine kinase